MRIRSRILYPVSRPPIENGGLFVYEDTIAAVGNWDHIRKMGTGEIIDLGDTILLPGLINAHCHLDYTNMAGKIPRPRTFPDWIKSILALKASWSFSEYADSWLTGAKMLLESGTTTVGDIEAVPELLPDLWNDTALRVISFLEMTGVKDDRSPTEILNEALRKIESLPSSQGRFGLSPHALYSTKPSLLCQSARIAAERSLRVAMHVAESQEEFEMFRSRNGLLFEWLKNQRDTSDCGNGSPIQQLESCGLLRDNFLAVHVNYLADTDAALLGNRRCHVVHCPSSHAYFRHTAFPYKRLKEAGVNICLGTDSLASFTPPQGAKAELNLFLEMKRFAEVFPTVPPSEIIEMATTNAAKALCIDKVSGTLETGSCADFIAIPSNCVLENASNAILNHSGRVLGSWIAGSRRVS